MPGPAPTRQRLLDAGMRLFAERGFRATAVGDIEAAVGLQPRRGALYKHFPSKLGLLEAGVQMHLDRTAVGAAEIGEIDLAALISDREQLRVVILEIGRWFLREMDSMKDLTRVLEHDGQRMEHLTAAVKTDVVDLSYRTVARLVTAIAPETSDPEAVAFVVLGPLVALRRTEWTFGSAPVALDDDRALVAWTESALALFASDSSDRTIEVRKKTVAPRIPCELSAGI